MADNASARFLREFPEAAGPRLATGERNTIDYHAAPRQREATPADIPELAGARPTGPDTVAAGLAVSAVPLPTANVPERRGPLDGSRWRG